jgi:antitoxin component HigA of HigAB toxin-antitoxin module
MDLGGGSHAVVRDVEDEDLEAAMDYEIERMMDTLTHVQNLTARHASTVATLVEAWEQQSFFIQAWSEFMIQGSEAI